VQNRPLIAQIVRDVKWRRTRGRVESAICKNDNKCLRCCSGAIRVLLYNDKYKF